MPPFVSVVVLNWNGIADTRACLDSLLAQAYGAFEVHLVDNASAGGEADLLAAEYGARVRLHRNAANLGFSGGNNVALRAILAEGRAALVALLNNDAEADPGWLAALVAAAERHPECGLFASRMVFHDQPDRIENAGIDLLRDGSAVPRGRGRRTERYDAAAEVLGACAGAALYRSRLLGELGLFREEFFANFEDVDLALRAQACGWRCRYVPGARVRHRLSRSIVKVRTEEFQVWSLRNLLLARRVNLPLAVLALDLPWTLLRRVVVAGLAPLLGQPQVARIDRAARRAAAAERTWVAARRAELAPRRRGCWLRLWWLERSVLPVWWRFFVEAVLLRRRGFLE